MKSNTHYSRDIAIPVVTEHQLLLTQRSILAKTDT
jgi:hypothetical protein